MSFTSKDLKYVSNFLLSSVSNCIYHIMKMLTVMVIGHQDMVTGMVLEVLGVEEILSVTYSTGIISISQISTLVALK